MSEKDVFYADVKGPTIEVNGEDYDADMVVQLIAELGSYRTAIKSNAENYQKNLDELTAEKNAQEQIACDNGTKVTVERDKNQQLTKRIKYLEDAIGSLKSQLFQLELDKAQQQGYISRVHELDEKKPVEKVTVPVDVLKYQGNTSGLMAPSDSYPNRWSWWNEGTEQDWRQKEANYAQRSRY